jgi:hypothetical protein
MRKLLLIFVVACGPRLPDAAIPQQYVCDDLALAFIDAAGTHHTSSRVEFASAGGDPATRTCRTRDRAHQALALFNDGTSLGSIAAELKLASAAEAREMVHAALIDVERRYYR